MKTNEDDENNYGCALCQQVKLYCQQYLLLLLVVYFFFRD